MKVRIIKDSAEPWYDFALITDIEDGIEVSVSRVEEWIRTTKRIREIQDELEKAYLKQEGKR